ncbi:hypothetical protein HSBAA_PA_1150 (plasmid) [Vreelandella sulfidaeris]|uniref:Uncharacterized protein n=1 Tax=Vreelandella sulfidaeris TaxID=115553 RepID=A0A455UGT0_9GAMM|nr:hypothetical protein HSBAA_PA_1150 [Halomonas sulfidaeris]
MNYDLLAQRYVPYSYFTLRRDTCRHFNAGRSIDLAGSPTGAICRYGGAVSVFKAVYIDKRELKCACVGGNSNVPLGFVSLTENLVMIAMGLWMPLRMLLG